MSDTPVPSPAPLQLRRTYLWWVILCLIGLDYFSSLAYVPSIAVSLMKDLAPIAALGVVVITLLAALPVYWYVVGRSHQGNGGIGLLERVTHGWGGKLLVLVMLGFVGTDFILTRTLSTSDAAVHIAANPVYRDNAGWILESLGADNPGAFWNEQLAMTVFLTVLSFGLYFYLVRSLSRGFLTVAISVVVLYLVVNVIVIGFALGYLITNGNLIYAWEELIRPELGDIRKETRGPLMAALLLALKAFPPMAIGLSGFELSMANAPLVRGWASDRPEKPAGRIFNSRLLMLIAALLMCLLIISGVFVVTLLVPYEAIGPLERASHRSLAYLAHGQQLKNDVSAYSVNPLAGPAFGTLYDISTVLILCLAGASATISLKDLLPEFLSRFGMQMSWAHRINAIMHLFNVVILLVTVAFRASVSAQLWAYGASVIALLFGASLAATLDLRQGLRGILGWVVSLPFAIIALLFAFTGFLIVYQNPVGVAIAVAFVLVVLVTAIVSRWLRSTEMRFDGFEFENAESERLWKEISAHEFQVLVPHDPNGSALRKKEVDIRERHRLADHIPIIFIEVRLGDPSDFHQKPLMRIDREGNEDVIRVSRCTSVAHVIAAIGLEFRAVGKPPELHFSWSEESPMAANLNFLLLGQGNVPWMVHALIRKAEKDAARRPRVIIG